MAEKDDQTVDEAVDESKEEVETSNEEDETSDDKDTADDTSEETDDEADDSDSSEEDDEPEQLERRFTQFKAETPEDYIQQLEDAYAKSTNEGQRLFQELEDIKEDLLTRTANQEPGKPEGQSKEPTIGERLALQNYRKQSREAFDSFLEKHPELKEDTALAQRLQKKVGLVSKLAMEEDGEIIDMKEALRISWAALGYDEEPDDTSNRQAIKERTSVSKTSNVKKKTKKSQFTEEQLAVAKRMYPNKTTTELTELLGKYKTT